MSNIPKLPYGLEFSVADHVARAEFFLNNALGQEDIVMFNWLLLAGINSARAAVEIVITDWDEIYKKGDKDIFLTEAEENVRHFSLIATVRVHDFHRGAIRLKPNAIAIYGPIKMKSGLSQIALSELWLTRKPQKSKSPRLEMLQSNMTDRSKRAVLKFMISQ